MSIFEAIGASVVYMAVGIIVLFPIVLLWDKYKYRLNDWLKEKFKN